MSVVTHPALQLLLAIAAMAAAVLWLPAQPGYTGAEGLLLFGVLYAVKAALDLLEAHDRTEADPEVDRAA